MALISFCEMIIILGKSFLFNEALNADAIYGLVIAVGGA